MTDTPKPPARLRAAGRRLWDGATAVYELRVDELPMLAEACRLVDDIEQIRRQLRDAPWMIPGSRGQDIVHPLRAELHRTTSRYESMVKTLGLPDDLEGGVSSSAAASWAGRNLARQRWG